MSLIKFHTQLKPGLYCYLVPTTYSGTELMNRIWKECILPEADIHYQEAVREILEGGAMKIHADPLLNVPVERENIRPRSVFTFDGCWQQLNSMMTAINAEPTARGFEGFKFAAATTMIQQPNDVGHMHKAVKNFYRGKQYREKTVEVPPYLRGFDITLSENGMEPSSVKTYIKALSYLETCLSKTCTIPMVREGFVISGVYPVVKETILSQWCGWSLCTKQQAEDVLSALPTLTTIAKDKGRITDQEIEDCMGDILDFDPALRKLDSCPLNHARCVWTNNDAVIAEFQLKREDDTRKVMARDEVKKKKQWKKDFPAEAAAEIKRVKLAAASELSPSVLAARQEKTVKCSNSSCNKRGTKLERNKEAKKWTGCRKKGCTLLFCETCIEVSKQHQSICEKCILSETPV